MNMLSYSLGSRISPSFFFSLFFLTQTVFLPKLEKVNTSTNLAPLCLLSKPHSSTVGSNPRLPVPTSPSGRVNVPIMWDRKWNDGSPAGRAQEVSRILERAIWGENPIKKKIHCLIQNPTINLISQFFLGAIITLHLSKCLLEQDFFFVLKYSEIKNKIQNINCLYVLAFI